MKSIWGAAAAAATLVLVSLHGTEAAAQRPPLVCNSDDQTLIKSTAGTALVCGKPAGVASVYTYQGIPYAQQTPRWAASQAAPWPATGPAVARTAFGPVCPQPTPLANQDEDCLSLNVWTPSNAINRQQSLPVMVFIHGGAFVEGAGSSPLYDGSQFASQNVVVVTLNYRLGALGFLNATAGSDTIGGNFGLLDQRVAMNWVKTNIAAFGGDPTKITLFGESAGAMSVGLHTLVMPDSSSLFSAALMESNPFGAIYQTPSDAQTRGNSFLGELCNQINCPTPLSLQWLQNAPMTIAQILTAQANAKGNDAAQLSTPQARLEAVFNGALRAPGNQLFPQSLPWAPVVDLNQVKGQPYNGYNSSVTSYKTIAFGVNRDEGMVFGAMASADPQYSKDFNPTDYGVFIHTKFPALAPAILNIDRYKAGVSHAKPSGATYNDTAAAVGNVITDYGFIAGNISAMLKAAQHSTVFGYQFTQQPFFDLYNLDNKTPSPDLGACLPPGTQSNTTYNVCHANELPYVFNTLSAVTVGSYKPNNGDQTLATKMNQAWVAFAKNPSNAASSGWTQFKTSTSGVQQWNSGTSSTVNLDSISNYSNIWSKTTPYTN